MPLDKCGGILLMSILLMSHTRLNSDLHVKDGATLLTHLGLPSMWVKGKNWKAQKLQRMCHSVVF